MKRVKQISIDILVDDSIDGFNLAGEVDNALKGQFIVLGCGFTEDLTEVYMEQYPELLKRSVSHYTVKQYWNGIHWDNSYTDDRDEAEAWKSYMEDKSSSIYDRVNGSALEEFIKEYNISNEESIEITVEIVEG